MFFMMFGCVFMEVGFDYCCFDMLLVIFYNNVFGQFVIVVGSCVIKEWWCDFGDLDLDCYVVVVLVDNQSFKVVLVCVEQVRVLIGEVCFLFLLMVGVVGLVMWEQIFEIMIN